MSKHSPETRAEFKNLILRRLGAPVINIEVSSDQVEDAVEEAIKYYQDYHYDGTEHIYYYHTADANNIANGWITIPEEIIGVTQVYSLNQEMYSISSANMFNGGYQMALDFAFSASGGSLLTYYMNKSNYELMTQILIGQTPIRYNRHLNKLHIDFDWNRMVADQIIVVDAYQSIAGTDMWKDRWLAKYATAKLKYIWGGNLSKYEGVRLPNEGTLNGTKIQDDANQEIQALEDEMISNYSIPPRDIIM